MPQDIRQIIPANGWVAVYIQDTPLYYFLEPLVCWALVHHAKTSLDVVEGFLTGEAYTGERYVEPAESSRNFYRYAYAPEITDADREYWTAGGQRGAQIVQQGEAPAGDISVDNASRGEYGSLHESCLWLQPLLPDAGIQLSTWSLPKTPLRLQVARARLAVPLRLWSHRAVLPPTTSPIVCFSLSPRDAATIPHLARTDDPTHCRIRRIRGETRGEFTPSCPLTMLIGNKLTRPFDSTLFDGLFAPAREKVSAA